MIRQGTCVPTKLLPSLGQPCPDRSHQRANRRLCPAKTKGWDLHIGPSLTPALTRLTPRVSRR